MTRRSAVSHEPPAERAALVGLVTRRTRSADPELQLEELAGLAMAAGATVVLRVVQERAGADPATLIGSGSWWQGHAEICCPDLLAQDHEWRPPRGRTARAGAWRIRR